MKASGVERFFTPFRMAGILFLPVTAIAPRSVIGGNRSTLYVSVSDAATHGFIADAQVRLPELGKLLRTDWQGEVRFQDLRSGRYKIEVRAIGYAPSDVDLMVKGDTAGAFFVLDRLGTQLDTVRVRAPVIPDRLQEYETRRRLGIGRFLTDSVLAKEGSHLLPLVIATRLPGLTVRSREDIKTHFDIVSRRGLSTLKGGGPCKVDVYLDGSRYTDDLEVLFPSDLMGVELYTAASAPPQYRRGTGACQVLLLWMRY